MICYDLILIFYKTIQQRLTLADGCNIDQNFFGHKAVFFWVFHKKAIPGYRPFYVHKKGKIKFIKLTNTNTKSNL